ncbi:MAG: hypothetical protein C5B51_13260 [Terriglobia bacterium]|nr:MAG: hypothetical protein C5B51_13260 [Terriglobia bacterium]
MRNMRQSQVTGGRGILKHLRHAAGALAGLLWAFPALAVDRTLDVSQYTHTAWTFRNGFLNGAVYAIAQSRDGYLWLGTQSGVVRFDGVRTEPLALPPGPDLPSSSVGSLLAARDGTLWIGTLDGLASWKNGRLTEYPALAHQTILALVEGRDGTVWAGGFGSPTGKLCAIRGRTTQCYGEDGSLGAAVSSLYEDADGSLWVGAATGEWRWNPGTPTRVLGIPVPNSQAFTKGDGGAGAMLAADGVYQLAGGKFVNYPVQGAPSPLTARTLLRDRRGGLWIGTQAHGIVHSQEGKTFLFTQVDGLTDDLVVALFEDREGTIWVATPKGLDQFRESPVGSLSVNAGLSSASTTSILAARREYLDRYGGWTQPVEGRADEDLPDAQRSRPAGRLDSIAVRGREGPCLGFRLSRPGGIRKRQVYGSAGGSCGDCTCDRKRSPRRPVAEHVGNGRRLWPGAPGGRQNRGAGALEEPGRRAGNRACARPGRRGPDGTIQRRDGVFSGRPNPEFALTRQPRAHWQAPGACGRSGRIAVGGSRKWSQPNPERAGGHADHRQRVTLRRRSLDHPGRPIFVLAIHAVRAFADRARRVGCLGDRLEADGPGDDVRHGGWNSAGGDS